AHWMKLFPALTGSVCAGIFGLFGPLPSAAQSPYLHAPAVNEYARQEPGSKTVLPDGRFLTPAGVHTPVAKWPHGMTVSPDGQTIFVASEGVGQLITGWESGRTPEVRQVVPGTGQDGKKRPNGGAAAFSPDGR